MPPKRLFENSVFCRATAPVAIWKPTPTAAPKAFGALQSLPRLSNFKTRSKPVTLIPQSREKGLGMPDRTAPRGDRGIRMTTKV